ncbi:hypothetical protein EDB92DRAFT_1283560 [Lactarius akahatsu]|uniref:Uncharacterized protein n=1 Tax=Lactarius akahatsu TaxID=416441 RepID=A0AAD4LCB8_9AGAM|nr:hypothetical protein EDB92DRAFT_1283560 [Lactarius akahatsu]
MAQPPEQQPPPQPDFHLIGNRLTGLADQVNVHPTELAEGGIQQLDTVAGKIHLMPNLPVVQQGHLAQQVQDILQRLDAIVARQDVMQVSINNLQVAMQVGMANLQAGLRMVPMQLRNAASSMTAPILIPQNDQIAPPGFPFNKLAIVTIDAVNAQAAAQYLGLPPLPDNATVEDRRQQLVDYLGCVYP